MSQSVAEGIGESTNWEIMSRGIVGSDPGLRGLRELTACSRSLGLRCGHFERIEQPLGDLQITPASTDFDVRFGDTVEIASAGYQ